ncbi:MAG: hypothetical protein OXR66_09110 [Candidatus Woesearchaeota archaeon]|nr:hypothetical protein [Candidatus Woesearchaeota archaeon]
MLTRHEVTQLFRNTKHKLLFSFLYSTGIPLDVLQQLRAEDIQKKNHRLTFQGKTYHLPWNTLQLLPEKGKLCSFTPNAIELLVRAAARQAGIQQPVTAALLRQSYPLHLVEKGVDLKLVRELLA